MRGLMQDLMDQKDLEVQLSLADPVVPAVQLQMRQKDLVVPEDQ